MEFRPCSTTGAALATVAKAKTMILTRNIVDGQEMGLRSWIGIRSDGCYRKAFTSLEYRRGYKGFLVNHQVYHIDSWDSMISDL